VSRPSGRRAATFVAAVAAFGLLAACGRADDAASLPPAGDPSAAEASPADTPPSGAAAPAVEAPAPTAAPTAEAPAAPTVGAPASPGAAAAPSTPPELAEGERLFDQNCARCHGPRATGTDQGPPFVHIIYEPNHHSDAAFQMAALNGVRAHHWQFGDMAPVPGVTAGQVSEITAYVRWLQRQAGID
jgi:mono/diheme cytochrome c family protein